MLTATPSDSTGDLVDELRVLMLELGRQVTHGGKEFCLKVLTDRDLGMSQVAALLALADRTDPAPISELALAIDLSVAAAGRNVDSLVQRGLVSRDEDPDDRRIKRVALTSTGTALLAEFRLTGQDHLTGRLATVPVEHLQRLLAAIRPVVDHLALTPASTEESA